MSLEERHRPDACSSRRCRICLGALLALLIVPAQAQIVAPAGRTLFNRGVLVRSLLRVDELSGGGSGAPERRWAHSTAVVWGARPNLSLTAVLPVISLESESRETTGTGDAAFFARWDLWRRNMRAGTTGLSMEVGARVPTGGAFGDGSTDPVATLIYSRVRDPHWFIGDLQAELPTTGDGGLRQGDRWSFDLAYLHRALPREGLGHPALYLVLELQAESRERSRLGGRTLSATGGDFVTFSPGVELILGRQWILEVAAPIPVDRGKHGDAPEPSAGAILGFRRLF